MSSHVLHPHNFTAKNDSFTVKSGEVRTSSGQKAFCEIERLDNVVLLKSGTCSCRLNIGEHAQRCLHGRFILCL